MNLKIADCSGECKKTNIIIANSFHMLCHSCNNKRLQNQRVIKKDNVNIQNNQKSCLNPKKMLSLRKISNKQKAIKAKLIEVYKQFDEITERICSGCGCNGYQDYLDHSHVISRARRPDLQTDINNIRYHCQSRCHLLWEHKLDGVEEMLDFEKNMKYIQSVDEQYYNQIGGKC